MANLNLNGRIFSDAEGNKWFMIEGTRLRCFLVPWHGNDLAPRMCSKAAVIESVLHCGGHITHMIQEYSEFVSARETEVRE
jgi:hypothetical protein